MPASFVDASLPEKSPVGVEERRAGFLADAVQQKDGFWIRTRPILGVKQARIRSRQRTCT